MANSDRAALGSSIAASVLMLAATTCRLEAPRVEGLDPGQMPQDVRADYALFAQRCSKCHTLSRPLQSGISDDTYWAAYVERMRRQPGSGISPDDATHILRFLHYFSTGMLVRHQDERTTVPAVRDVRDGGDEW